MRALREEEPLRVLSVTNMYPTPDRPAYGAFVASQIASLRAAGVRTEVLFLDGRAGRSAYLRAVPAIRRALRTARYDLLHAHYGLTGFLATLATRMPVVVSFCGDDLLGTPSRGGRRTAASRALCALSRAAARRAAGVIVKSREMLARLPEPVRARGASIIPNGVDLALFSPRPRMEARSRLGLGANDRVVLFPHTPDVPRKRLDLARAAASRLDRNGDRVTLRIVHGLPQERLVDEYAAADCLLVTSAWEGSPNVVKEGLAMGVPIVSVDCGDVRDWIEELPGCVLVERDADAIASGLEAALAHGPLGGAARERIDTIEIGSVARRVIAVYRDALRR